MAGHIWPVGCILLIPDLEDMLSLLPPPQCQLASYVLDGDQRASLLPNLCVTVLSPPACALLQTQVLELAIYLDKVRQKSMGIASTGVTILWINSHHWQEWKDR